MQSIVLLLTILIPACIAVEDNMDMNALTSLQRGDTLGPIDSKRVELLDDSTHVRFFDSEQNVVMVDRIQEVKRFRNKDDMLKYASRQVTTDSAVIQVTAEKLQQLQGKRLEVLTSNPLKHEDIKLMCHSNLIEPALCHAASGDSLFSIVRDVETGDTFPTVVSKHLGGCSFKDLASGNINAAVTHINEFVIIDKNKVE